MLRTTLTALALFGSLATGAFAGTPVYMGKDSKSKVVMEEDKVPLDLFSYEFNFVNSSSVRGAHGGLGDQNVMSSDFIYGHRIQLKDSLYLRLGFEYTRFDFGTTNSPLPNHLQSFSAPIALEYIKKGIAVAALEVNPGFWFQNDIHSDAFDMPWRAYVTIPIQDKKVYAVIGAAGASFYPKAVLPVGGLVVIFNDQLHLDAVFPKPALVYQPNASVEYRIGGELLGGGYRTDGSDQARYDRTVVSYYDVHGGAEVNYKGIKGVTVGVGAGWSFQREFDYIRSDKRYNVNGAPYAKFAIAAEF